MSRRGTELTPQNRFVPIKLEVDEFCDDGDVDASPIKTQWFWDDTQSIVTENNSPDIPFRFSLNPYRGCEHGCAYCYARPFHEYLGWNAGIDFETKILAKSNAHDLLRQWLSRPSWNGSDHLMMSGVTDPYQPVESKLRITRNLIEVCAQSRQAISIITKNALIERDIDLLSELATHHAAGVTVSMTTLDPSLARIIEPRCSAPQARLRAISELSKAGIPVHVNFAPVIPGLNDFESANLLEAIAAHGASSATWILLRLPGAVEPIFIDWLATHLPNVQQKILDRLATLRGGNLNDPRFKHRMRGEGFFSDEFSKFFSMLRKKHGLQPSPPPLATECFRPPSPPSGQLLLF